MRTGWLLAVLLGCASVGAQSTRLSFEGQLSGDLPLELEFLALAHKHGIHVNAPVTGTLKLDSMQGLFSDEGTTTIELTLQLADLQELTARLTQPGLRKALAAGTATVQIGSSAISMSDPNAFPARIGGSEAADDSGGFVLAGIELSLSPTILDEPTGTSITDGIDAKLLLRRKTAAKDETEDESPASLSLVFTEMKTMPRDFDWGETWFSVSSALEDIAFEMEFAEFANSGGADDPGGGNTGGTGDGDDGGLILIPEPSMLAFWVAAIIGGLGWRRRR